MRAGIVESLKDLERYPYTSHAALMGHRDCPWQDAEHVLALFDKTVSRARKKYSDYVARWSRKGRRRELTGGGLVRSAGGWHAVRQAYNEGIRLTGDERILSSSEFVEKTLALAGEEYERRTQLINSGIELAAVYTAVCKHLDLEKGAVTSRSRRSSAVLARGLISYIAVNELGMSGSEVARHLDVDRSTINRAAMRIEKDRFLQESALAVLFRLQRWKTLSQQRISVSTSSLREGVGMLAWTDPKHVINPKEEVTMNRPGMSTEARAFMASLVRNETPTDFSRIAQIREETRTMYADGAERAIERHGLVREDLVLGGVECERVLSRKSSRARGTLVYIFGGGFTVGCPYSDMPIIGALAHWCQVDVIAPKYRLAPEHPAPAAADDCVTVWQQTAALSDGPLLLAGESAGGNLAVVLAQRALSEGLRMPEAMALLSPAVDLRTDLELYEPTANADPTLSPVILSDVIAAYGAGRDPSDPVLSPLFGPLDGLPPTIITTGTRDMLLSMCLRLDRQMRRAGVEVECRVWDGFWHVFEYYDQYPEAEESLREIAAFLNGKSGRVLRRHSGA